MTDRVVISEGLMENQSCTVSVSSFICRPQTKTEIQCRASGFLGSEIEKCVWRVRCVCVLPRQFDIIALRSHTPWGHDDMSHL